MAKILPEHGYGPSCGNFGVRVVRTKSKFEDSASMEVQYDEFIDYDQHKLHSFVVPWNGGKVSDAYVEHLLDSANVPSYIQDVSAYNMVLSCVDQIIKDCERPDLSSVLVSVTSDKDTLNYSEYFGVEDSEKEKMKTVEDSEKEKRKTVEDSE